MRNKDIIAEYYGSAIWPETFLSIKPNEEVKKKKKKIEKITWKYEGNFVALLFRCCVAFGIKSRKRRKYHISIE